jgi:hypothetical protein
LVVLVVVQIGGVGGGGIWCIHLILQQPKQHASEHPRKTIQWREQRAEDNEMSLPLHVFEWIDRIDIKQERK